MEEVIWKEAKENDLGIETIAFEYFGDDPYSERIVGYNGILKGDTVLLEGEKWTVVMVSRLGHIGLSQTGTLPYTKTTYPRGLTKVVE